MPKFPPDPLKKNGRVISKKCDSLARAIDNNTKSSSLVRGLSGSSAASSLAAMGYDVHCYCFQDSPRRAHSIAAQGGINAAKNYRNDGDSVFRLFMDTQKGGDFRAREANVYRLAECSTGIIDQAVAQGVPFAREYGGMLANRSFGGVLVQRTFYCRGENWTTIALRGQLIACRTDQQRCSQDAYACGGHGFCGCRWSDARHRLSRPGNR